MIHQNGKITTFLMIGIVAAVFGFSLYVLLITKNTIIVINEAAQGPTEVVVAPTNPPTPEAPAPNSRVQILTTDVGFLNVRDGASTSATKVGTVKPGEVYEYTEIKDNWYHLAHPTLKEAWVFGQYVKEVDRSTDLFGGSQTAP
jgi:uncharacterized protein YgiM (DUF1202 family)